jgi:uncharacterized membrane protein (UPF0127 family)
MKPAKLYTVEVTEEGEDLVIEFPEEIVQEQGWIVGDKLEWIIHSDYVILRKAPDEDSGTE